MSTPWVQNPRLWEVARKKTEKLLPPSSRAYWRKVAATYKILGGKYFEEDGTDDGGGPTDQIH